MNRRTQHRFPVNISLHAESTSICSVLYQTLEREREHQNHLRTGASSTWMNYSNALYLHFFGPVQCSSGDEADEFTSLAFFDLLIIWSSSHFVKRSSRASFIHLYRQHSPASGMVSQLLCRVFCSGQHWSSSFTSKANMEALHKPSGLNLSWRVLLLNSYCPRKCWNTKWPKY